MPKNSKELLVKEYFALKKSLELKKLMAPLSKNQRLKGARVAWAPKKEY